MLKKMKNLLKDQRGLTLIELLAVIVILGIIAAIAVPSIGGIIEKSRNNAKVAEALQIIDAAKLSYANDSTKTTWTDSTSLDSYITKVQDTTFTVTYTPSTNIYTIKGHDSATVIDSNYTATTEVTENEIAQKASN